MKVLCLVHDDKFIDDLIITYERLGVNAEFIDIVKAQSNFKYIKRANRIIQVVAGSQEYCDYAQCKGFDIVWVHYATEAKMRFVAACPQSVLVVWSTWGSDYCSLLNNYIFEFRTLLKWISAHSIRECVGYFVRTGLSLLRLQKLWMKPHVRVFLQRVSFYSTVLPNEAVLVERLLRSGARRVDFHYVRHGYKENKSTSIHKVRNASYVVLVGNSATYSNNTFDALNKLSRENSISRVICPLSYGESRCAKQIDEYGRSLFGNRWNPIFEFLPLSAYLDILVGCDVFVFNHIRQQAIGNIQGALKMGGLVILNDKSPAWRYYKSIGVKVYSMNQLLSLGLKNLFEDFGETRDDNIRRLNRFRNMEMYLSDMSLTFKFLEGHLGGKQ